MVANLSLNQFAPNTPLDGMYVYMANEGQLHNVIVGAETTLKAGDMVAIDTSSTNTNAPVVLKADMSDASTIPFGVVSYNPVKSSYTTGERVGLARDYDVIWKTASEIIPAGVPVVFDANHKVRVVDNTDTLFNGISLTPASAEGDLIQVELKLTLLPQ